MALELEIDHAISRDASGAIRRASKRWLEDGLAKGFAVSQDKAPEDRGTLRQSGFKPTWDGDTLRFGYRANHAEPMEYGTQPYWAPIEPLKQWADRVVGDPGFGYYVQQKIAEEGIEAQPYMKPAAEASKRWLKNRDFSKYMDKEL